MYINHNKPIAYCIIFTDCRIFMHDKCYKAFLYKAKHQIYETITSKNCTKQIINVSPEVAYEMCVEYNQEHNHIIQLDVCMSCVYMYIYVYICIYYIPTYLV